MSELKANVKIAKGQYKYFKKPYVKRQNLVDQGLTLYIVRIISHLLAFIYTLVVTKVTILYNFTV